MNLSSIDVFPGVVIENKDAECLGRIKCSVISEMDATNVDPKILPWVKPLFGGNNFSIPKKGDKVWVFKNINALDDYRWASMYDVPATTQQYIQENNSDNTHVLMNNENGYTASRITHDDTNGFVFTTNGSTLNIKPQDGISFIGQQTKIVADNNYYLIGKNASESAVKGDKLRSLLSDISAQIKELSNIASSNPYTSILSQPLMNISSTISNALDDILSNNIKIE